MWVGTGAVGQTSQKKKNFYILFPYIFEIDDIQLNSGIIYRYIIERVMDKCKQSFILQILLESVA